MQNESVHEDGSRVLEGAPFVGWDVSGVKNLYVHIPFCERKCRYCAFYSETGVAASERDAVPAVLAREAALRGVGGETWDTVYVGGGTPSLLSSAALRALGAAFPRAEGAEFTVELNPADVTDARVEALREAGVTRVSLGVQSFCDETLRFLGRRHDAACARRALRRLLDGGFRAVSLDLITAIPGEPDKARRDSLAEAAASGAAHVSVYPLSVEPGTGFFRDGVRAAGDEAYLAAVGDAECVLGEAGYMRYEISNYARPGFECRHNLAVWRGADYVGLGPGAASRVGLERRTNQPSFAAWREAIGRGILPPADSLVLTEAEDETERFLTRVRLARWRGPDPATDVGRRRLARLAMLEKAGIVRPLGERDWALTPRGREVVDAVMADLNV